MKKGFTLAEILITLAVIGIVATLTLPNLLQNYRERVYTTQLQRAYNSISNALVTHMAEENAESLGDTLRSRDDIKAFLYKYLKVARYCGGSGSFNGTCFAEDGKYREIDSSNYQDYRSVIGYDRGILNVARVNNQSSECVMLNTGATVCMSTFDFNAKKGIITLDTNGGTGPNVNGKDFFGFYYFADGSVGSFSGTEDRYYGYSNQVYCRGLGFGCLDKAMAQGWKLNYDN